MHKNSIPLVLAFTPNYYVPACTCLVSILESSNFKGSFHVICLLTEELNDEMRNSLAELIGPTNTLSFLNLAGKIADDIYVDEKYTVAANYRLLLPDLLPEFDTIIYIDCDIIVRNDLAELFHSVDLTGHYMAGVFEATLDFQKEHMLAIGCDPGKYINSGLLLMNLRELRQDNMSAKFLDALRFPGLEFPDQDVINQLCAGKIIGLPPYWNSIRTFFIPAYKDNFLQFYSEDDWINVQQKGNIHYTGPKPWNTFTVAFDIWWKYYNNLPNSIKKFNNYSSRIRLLAAIYATSLGKNLLEGVRKFIRR
ncbi:glycosyltransferase family 8 protein [Sphingobacterium corticibacter]|uniref:Glycosyltransferase family 8 protein n=1 Tax=Sphingobacterium corticibacter TaxID=2171749 RepID=A0A2T8HK61_9SPHI|nr:glycosyltransferase family 8 protein [Sphingobacterium corticibacter]PVH25831.1 glycosyltransferase family 8 protein [Sphingobacterium corticibacter]